MTEQKTLNEILKKVKKDYGDNVLKVGVEDLTSVDTLSLGSPGLDFCLYNRFPTKRIIELCGPEASGKTTMSYLIAASYQKKELLENKDNPRKILFCDLECSLDPTWAIKTGYDMNTSRVETICFRPEDQSAEQIFDIILDIIKTGEVGMVIIDSLSMLVSQQTHDESFEKKEMGGIAKVLGDFTKRVTSLLVKYNCTLIGINQIRENIGGYGNPLVTSGGRGWKHGCSVRLMLKKGSFFDEEGNILSSSAESPAGYIMECAVLKTKVCKWDRKLGRTCISYTKGVDILQDTIDVATYFGLIDNSVQGTFTILDPETSEPMLDEKNNPIKIRGKKNIKPFFETNLDLWKRLYNAVYDKLSKTEDPNIISFEKMLGINIQENFGVNFAKEEE